MEQKVIAFWEYDQFPNILCGEVVKFRRNGSVETIQYGKGYYFKPVILLPYDDGMILKEKLDCIEKEFDDATNLIKAEYNEKLEKILKEYNKS